MITEVHTAAEAIEALGGTKALAAKLGTTYQAVHNWRNRGLPFNRIKWFERALSEKSCTASPSLWRQRDGT